MKEKIKSFFKNKQNIKKILLGFALVVILVISIFISLFINKINDYYPKQYVKVSDVTRDTDILRLYLDDSLNYINLSIGYNRQIIDCKLDDGNGNLKDSSLSEFLTSLSQNTVYLKYKDYNMNCIVYKIGDEDTPSYNKPSVVCNLSDRKIIISVDFYRGPSDAKVSIPVSINLLNGNVLLSDNLTDEGPDYINCSLTEGDNDIDISNKNISNLNDLMALHISDNIYNIISSVPNEDYLNSILNESDSNTSSESEENPNQDSDGFIELPNELEIDN